jgi:ATP-binding cassette subfamily C (CFTR/MRP) protein 1
MLRSGLISAIYDQTLLLQAQDLGDATAITLMGTDVERIVVNLKNIHESWASILEVGIAIWLLERQLWVACVVPVVICFGRTLSLINRSATTSLTWFPRVCVRYDAALESIRRCSEAMDRTSTEKTCSNLKHASRYEISANART